MGQARLPKEKRERIIELRAQGHSYTKIAEIAGVSRNAAVEECKREAGAVRALQELETEALFEEYKLGAIERARARADLLRGLREEFEARSLADIPTAKLVELYSKELSNLSEERERGAKSLNAQGDTSDAKELITARVEEIKGLLTAEGKYTEELQLQVILAAQLSLRTEELAAAILAGGNAPSVEDRKNPVEALFLSYAERTQQALKALGLNTDAKTGDKENSEDYITIPRPLYDLLNAVGRTE